MKRSIVLIAPLALAMVVGCSSGESSLQSILDAERTPALDGAASVGSGDGEEGGDAATTTAPTAPPLIGGDTEAYCRLARSFEESNDEINESFESFAFDTEAIRESFAEAQRQVRELVRAAPAEIRDEVAVLAEGFGRLFTELDAVDFNFFALDFEALEELSEGFDTAVERIEEYHERVCGIPRTTFDDDFGGFDDEMELGDLEDIFGEFGEMFGEDFDMGEFGDFFIDMLVEQFVSEGYSPAEARCLAEAAFDLEGLFGALAEDGPGSFENFEDPFTRCGVAER